MTRTHLVRLFALLTSAVALQSAHGFELVIAHSNDTHSFAAGIDAAGNPCYNDKACYGGYARLAAAVKSVRSSNPAVLYLDAGDTWMGTPYFTFFGEKMVAQALNELKPDAVTFGNHEFDLGCAKAKTYAEKLHADVIAANFQPPKDCPFSQSKKLKPWVVRTFAGPQGPVKVGIVGIASFEAKIDEAHFADTEKTLKQAVADLKKEGVEIVVALTHVGLPIDLEIARRINGIDAVVGGHSHDALGVPGGAGPYPIVIERANGEKCAVVTAGRATRYFGELHLDIDANGNLQSCGGREHVLTPEAPGDASMQKLVASFSAKLSEIASEKVIQSDVHEDNALEVCRLGECLSGDITADAYLYFARKYGASIALVNGGSIRAGVHRGALSRADLLAQHPFNDGVCVISVKGETVTAAIENGLASEDRQKPELLQVAGLRYKADLSRAAWQRVTSVEVPDGAGGWKKLDPKADFTVVIPGYLYTGGDKFAMLKNAELINADDRPTALKVVEKYLATVSRLSSPETGRIEIREKH